MVLDEGIKWLILIVFSRIFRWAMAEPQLPSFEPEDEKGWHLVFRQTSPFVWPKGKLDLCKYDHLSDNFAKVAPASMAHSNAFHVRVPRVPHRPLTTACHLASRSGLRSKALIASHHFPRSSASSRSFGNRRATDEAPAATVPVAVTTGCAAARFASPRRRRTRASSSFSCAGRPSGARIRRGRRRPTQWWRRRWRVTDPSRWTRSRPVARCRWRRAPTTAAPYSWAAVGRMARCLTLRLATGCSSAAGAATSHARINRLPRGDRPSRSGASCALSRLPTTARQRVKAGTASHAHRSGWARCSRGASVGSRSGGTLHGVARSGATRRGRRLAARLRDPAPAARARRRSRRVSSRRCAARSRISEQPAPSPREQLLSSLA